MRETLMAVTSCSISIGVFALGVLCSKRRNLGKLARANEDLARAAVQATPRSTPGVVYRGQAIRQAAARMLGSERRPVSEQHHTPSAAGSRPHRCPRSHPMSSV